MIERIEPGDIVSTPDGEKVVYAVDAGGVSVKVEGSKRFKKIPENLVSLVKKAKDRFKPGDTVCGDFGIATVSRAPWRNGRVPVQVVYGPTEWTKPYLIHEYSPTIKPCESPEKEGEYKIKAFDSPDYSASSPINYEVNKFQSGAIRENKEGKGRCDLLPFITLTHAVKDSDAISFFSHMELFKQEGNIYNLAVIIEQIFGERPYEMTLDLAKRFEKGANEYGERNWEKGIPIHSFIDSAVRHYLKFKAGYKDERHDIALAWNLICCIWTMKNHPEMDDFTSKGRGGNNETD